MDGGRSYQGCPIDHNNRAEMYFKLGEYENAIQFDPDYAYAYNDRGLVYADLGQDHRAIQDYDKAIHLDPG